MNLPLSVPSLCQGPPRASQARPECLPPEASRTGCGRGRDGSTSDDPPLDGAGALQRSHAGTGCGGQAPRNCGQPGRPGGSGPPACRSCSGCGDGGGGAGQSGGLRQERFGDEGEPYQGWCLVGETITFRPRSGDCRCWRWSIRLHSLCGWGKAYHVRARKMLLLRVTILGLGGALLPRFETWACPQAQSAFWRYTVCVQRWEGTACWVRSDREEVGTG